MPELPDVETIRRLLEARLDGATISAARSTDRYVLRPQSPGTFARSLVGRRVREIDRRGKWLRLGLDDGGRLFSHLGMTGWWVERGLDAAKEPSERARVDVATAGGRTRSLRYVDSRRFGRLIVAQDDIAAWRELGPDPLVDGIRVPALAEALGRSRRAVKDALMDQAVLAGIGNILATEALWRARIDPRSRGDALSEADVRAIARGLMTEIRRELAVRAASRDDEWRDVFAVYGHRGKPCPRCGTAVASVVLGGRSSAFCPGCQVRRR
jgi:formamidopyrimidine-DNA glycosylase